MKKLIAAICLSLPVLASSASGAEEGIPPETSVFVCSPVPSDPGCVGYDEYHAPETATTTAPAPPPPPTTSAPVPDEPMEEIHSSVPPAPAPVHKPSAQNEHTAYVPVERTELPRTGPEGVLALAGASLVALGAALVGAGRRLAR